MNATTAAELGAAIRRAERDLYSLEEQLGHPEHHLHGFRRGSAARALAEAAADQLEASLAELRRALALAAPSFSETCTAIARLLREEHASLQDAELFGGSCVNAIIAKGTDRGLRAELERAGLSPAQFDRRLAEATSERWAAYHFENLEYRLGEPRGYALSSSLSPRLRGLAQAELARLLADPSLGPKLLDDREPGGLDELVRLTACYLGGPALERAAMGGRHELWQLAEAAMDAA